MPTAIRQVGPKQFVMYDANTRRVVGHSDSRKKAEIFKSKRDQDVKKKESR